jgi:hypothetical protein
MVASSRTGQVWAEPADNCGNDGIIGAAVLYRLGWGDVEGSPAESLSVRTDDESHIKRRRASISRLVGDVEYVDPVTWAGIVVIEQAPGTVWLLMQFRCPEEGLPRVPDWLRQRQHASGGGIAPGHLELERDLIKGPLEDIRYIWSLDPAPCPFRVLSQLLRKTITVQVQGTRQSSYSMLITAVRVRGLEFDDTVLTDAQGSGNGLVVLACRQQFYDGDTERELRRRRGLG